MLLVGAGLIGVASVLFGLALLLRSRPPLTPSGGAVSPAPATDVSPVAALVEGEAISLAEWRRTAALDQVLSALAGQPAPAAEATLERLINAQLVLQTAAAEGFSAGAGAPEAEARLAALQQQWGADDAALTQALASAGLTRAELLAEIARLLRVEAYLQTRAATQDAQAWLAGRRATARVSVLVDIAAPAQAAVEPPVATVAETAPAPSPAVDPLPAGVFEGQRALDFELAATTGARLRLSDLRGRPVAINFWATWCPACREELPALEAAYEQFGARGVAVLGVDLREDASTVTAFAGQFGLSFPLLLDADGAVANDYRVLGIPTTVFVDAAGVVRARHVGPLTEEKFAEYVTPLLPAAGAVETEAPAGAPAFSLPRESGVVVSLADYRAKESVVLVFYRGQT